ncbi:MAG: hypothetical protein EBS05_26195 [Proteobacteria bacterium]|nr:hypothetical protein [Pseudomonadota bacterium]
MQSQDCYATAAARGNTGIIISVHDVGYVTEEINKKGRDDRVDREACKLERQKYGLLWKLLQRKILNLLALTCECAHPPEFALASLPECQSQCGRIQVTKGEIATSIGEAVMCAKKTVEDLSTKIARLEAKQSPAPADAQELAQELARARAALLRAEEMTDPGCYYQEKDKKPVWIQHPECVKHDPKMLCGWPLQKFPKGVFEEAAGLLQELDKLPGTDRAFVSTKKVNSTVLLSTCLRALAEAGAGVDGAAVAAGKYELKLEKGIVTKLRRMLADRPIRGDPGSDVFNLFTQQFEFQIDRLKQIVPVRAFIPELLDRLSKCDPNYGIDDPESVFSPVEIAGVPHPIPDSLLEILKGARRGDLQQIIDWGLGYEEIASLIPQMLAAAEANGDAARPHPARTVLENIVATVLPIWPHRLLPKNLIEGLRTLAKQASIELHLVEYSAIVKWHRPRVFHPTEMDHAAAQLAARASSEVVKLHSSDLYAGFFKIPEFWPKCTYRQILQYADIRYQDDYNEAEKVLTTQNLAQLFGLGLTFDCAKLAALTWSRIVAMITDADKCWGPSTYPPSWAITECITGWHLQLEMEVTNAWRQFVYYVSRVDNKMGLLTELQVLNKRSLACRRVIATHDYCVEMILQPLIDVVKGLLPVKPPPLHLNIGDLKW